MTPSVSPSVSSPSAAHHGLAAHEVVLLLGSDPHCGLSGQEVTERLARFGPNTLPATKEAGLVVRILRQFHHPLIYVLLAAGGITAGLGEYVDSAVIFGVVVINAVVGFVQESKAEAALEGLRSMVRTLAKVVRDGHERTVPSDELVPGDLVLLDAGDKVPADVRLTRSAELRGERVGADRRVDLGGQGRGGVARGDSGGRPAEHGLLGHPGDHG